MKKQLAILGIAVLQSLSSRAQDPHFSQYFVSPLTVNPALTGFMDGTARAMVNYRSQWANVNNAFTTATASVDGIILQGKLPQHDRLGIGLMAMSDKVANGLMTNTYVSLSTAYHKSLDKEGNYSLAIGLQGSYANRNIDGSKLILNDELDELGVFSQPSGDAAKGQQLGRNYFDVSAGMLFRARFNEKNQFYIGMSAYHLASPKVTFMDNLDLTVPVRMTLNGAFESKVSDMLSLSLLGMYTKQEEASETVVGAIGTIGKSAMEFDKPLILYAGVLYRVQDAFIPYVGVEYHDVRFGFTYDMNTSTLNAATRGQGGAEVSIIYLLRIPPNKRIQYLCPNNPKF
jgi:type IX secretion system PorP/SprF family membrane protein